MTDHPIAADSIEKIAAQIEYAAHTLASFRLFVNSREKAKQPEGRDLYEECLSRLGESVASLRAFTAPQPIATGQEAVGNLSRYRPAVGAAGDEHMRVVAELNALKAARRGLDVAPEPGIPAIDLSKLQWEAIRTAAQQSKWIPPQYYSNDWVSDVETFLREGPEAFMPDRPAAAPEPYPLELFDSYSVLQELTTHEQQRTSAENVTDVLNATVRLMRKRLPAAAPSPPDGPEEAVSPWEEVARHIRYCRTCGESDVSACHEGSELWDAALAQRHEP